MGFQTQEGAGMVLMVTFLYDLGRTRGGNLMSVTFLELEAIGIIVSAG